MNPDVGLIVNDPSWLVHRYDPGYDAFHFRRVTRDEQRRAPFLIEEYLPPSAPVVLVRADVDAALHIDRIVPVQLLLHSAFCCSTLVGRAFDQDGLATVLREPVVLNDLVGWQQRGAPPARFDAVLGSTLRLLGRPFEQREGVVVKPSNILNTLAAAMLKSSAEARAVLMYAPLTTFLTSVAKKGMDGRLWVRGLFLGLLKSGVTDFGYDAEAVFGQTDLQVAALGWLAQHRLFNQLLAGPMSEHVRSLGSDVLLGDPGFAIERIGAMFNLPLSAQAARTIGEGPVFRRHSKTGVEFATEDRRAEYETTWHQHGDEIEKVAQWTAEVARLHKIPLDLPHSILG